MNPSASCRQLLPLLVILAALALGCSQAAAPSPRPTPIGTTGIPIGEQIPCGAYCVQIRTLAMAELDALAPGHAPITLLGVHDPCTAQLCAVYSMPHYLVVVDLADGVRAVFHTWCETIHDTCALIRDSPGGSPG